MHYLKIINSFFQKLVVGETHKWHEILVGQKVLDLLIKTSLCMNKLFVCLFLFVFVFVFCFFKKLGATYR